MHASPPPECTHALLLRYQHEQSLQDMAGAWHGTNGTGEEESLSGQELKFWNNIVFRSSGQIYDHIYLAVGSCELELGTPSEAPWALQEFALSFFFHASQVAKPSLSGDIAPSPSTLRR
eukprot:3773844-Karenia_brevis.AAC.1